jgi:hypothetical protein
LFTFPRRTARTSAGIPSPTVSAIRAVETINRGRTGGRSGPICGAQTLPIFEQSHRFLFEALAIVTYGRDLPTAKSPQGLIQVVPFRDDYLSLREGFLMT